MEKCGVQDLAILAAAAQLQRHITAAVVAEGVGFPIGGMQAGRRAVPVGPMRSRWRERTQYVGVDRQPHLECHTLLFGLRLVGDFCRLSCRVY